MQKAEKRLLTRAILFSNALVICDETDQVVVVGSSILHFMEEKHQVAGYRIEVHKLCYFEFLEYYYCF